PGLPSNGLNLDRAVINLGNLLLKEAAEHEAMRPRDDDLRSAKGVIDLGDVDSDPLLRIVTLGRHLLGPRHQRLGPSELHHDVALLDALDDPVDDLVLAVGELVVNHLALGLAQFLNDDLLGGLRGDTSKVEI